MDCVDGRCKYTTLGNGAGLGVYWKAGDRRNIAMALPGKEQTAQRAEVRAPVQALH